jgi:hypothetical protein
MKVALDAGDVLDVALLDGDRVIGTLSLQIKGLAGSSPRVGRPAAASSSETSSTTSSRKRKQRKPLSEEAKARMAAAQKERWAKRRAEQGQ